MRYKKGLAGNFLDRNGWRAERINEFGGHSRYSPIGNGKYVFEQDATNTFRATNRRVGYV